MIRLTTQVGCIAVLLLLVLHAGTGVWDAIERPADAAFATSGQLRPAIALVVERQALEFKGQELAAFPETATRPVFFEGRRYPEAAKAANLEPPAQDPRATPVATRISADGIKLLGVMIQDGKAQALIEAASQPPAWVTVGAKVQAWTVQAIRNDSVRLDSNTASQFATVSLYESAAAK